MAVESVDSASQTATPHHFTTASHPGNLCGIACVEAPRPTRRVKPEPEPNWPKVCVITSIDNNCKSTALRALHAQDIVAEAAHSKTASPIVAEAARPVQ